MSGNVTIFYGEMGSGKSYRAKKIAERHDLPFLEGDDLIEGEMLRKVVNFQPLTKEEIDDFIHYKLFHEICDRGVNTHLVVSQALYRRENRDRLKKQLEDRGFIVNYHLVKVPFTQNLKQLWGRRNGLKWIAYWLLNKPFFQE